MDEYSFSYNTTDDNNVCFTKWEVGHNINNDIYIKYNQKGADLAKIYYQVNNGTKILYYNKIKTSSEDTIPSEDIINLNIASLDDSGVRKGRSVSGINEYKVFIELYKKGIMESNISFKIWNVPGMVFTDDNPLIEVRTEADLIAMKNGLDKQYVLANDIVIFNEWTPIGTEANPFEGKFYGNGHTIKMLRGINPNADYAGFFGVVKHEGFLDSTVIRDFNLIYPETGNVPTTSTCFGGIAGKIDGMGVTIRNIIIGGSYYINYINNQSLIFGGIVGYQDNNARIINCLVDVNFSINSSSEIDNFDSFLFGGAIGKMGASNYSGLGPVVEAVNVTSNIGIDGIIATQAELGGIIGRSESGILRYLHFSGDLQINIPSGYVSNINLGGIAGSIKNSTIENCYFAWRCGCKTKRE